MTRPELSSASDVGVEVRVLGELSVLRGGVALALPQSKKARALLGYLVLTRRAHRRERLSSLFWDVTDDPRGALRWTLSRVRSAIDSKASTLIAADREDVRFEHSRASIDYFRLPELIGPGLEQAPIEALERAAALFGGELLEGSDLPDFFEFTAWLSAERAEARRIHGNLLSALSQRITDPERSLPYARARVQIDPLDQSAALTFVRSLVRAGRRIEAEEHCESVARLLDGVGERRGSLLSTLRSELSSSANPRRAEPAPAQVAEASPDEVAFIGRESELAAFESARAASQRDGRPALLLVTGDPGMGKTRLLAEAMRRLRKAGAKVFSASAFEADRSLPFLPWSELLRSTDVASDAALARDLSPLLAPPGVDAVPDSTREGLFRAVTRALERVDVIVFDDAQWLDDASTSLLHHCLRTLSQRSLLCVLAARRGELVENPALVGLLRGARRERGLREVELAALSEHETLELVRSAEPAVDPERIVRESDGSPLFALELSRFEPGPGSRLPRSLRELVAERLERLPRPSAEIVQWAATLGSHFDAEVLSTLSGLGPDELLRHLETLERHAFLRPAPGARGLYVFRHQLLERAIGLGISEPRRRLMHRRIAELLSARGSDEAVNDVSRHAALGGDSELAAKACLRAAERCLRVFANDEARRFARRGLRHAAVLEDNRRLPLEIQLHRCRIVARRPSDVDSAVTTLLELAERALDLGYADDARAAYRLVSVLRWEAGRFAEAELASARIETIGRAGTLTERARAMGEAGQCLALLERDLPKAEALLLEARALANKGSLVLFGVSAGLGVLARYRGETRQAFELFSEARSCSRLEGERSSEFEALSQLVELSYETGDLERAERDGAELEELGEKLREGSEPAYARALNAVIRYARGDRRARAEIESARAELRLVDAAHRLATIELYTAELELDRGEPAQALDLTRSARALSSELGRDNDVIIARALGLCAEYKLGNLDSPECRETLELLRQAPKAPLSARAQRAVSRLKGIELS